MTARQLALYDPDHARFVEWVRANPAVVEAFREAALAWVRAGHRKASARMLVEVVRWQHGLGLVTEDTDGQGFRINNNHTARLGRHVVETTRELPPDLFETRRLKYDGALAEPDEAAPRTSGAAHGTAPLGADHEVTVVTVGAGGVRCSCPDLCADHPEVSA